MVRRPVNPPARGWSLTLRPRDWARLERHLFGDGDEHGAVVLARLVDGPRGQRLLGAEVLLAEDGVDYVPGTHGYRALTAKFVRDAALHARAGGLAYIAFHNHGGTSHVGFSATDLESHERGYPAIARVTGNIAGAVVCTPQAAAGDLWVPNGGRAPLAEMVVPGASLLRLRSAPASIAGSSVIFDRQARLFGDIGQACFSNMRVAVVGLGGVGSILTEYLARLGVGSLVLIDDDTVDETNLPRLLGARRRDVGKAKVILGERNARRANPSVDVIALQVPVQEPQALDLLTQCDWIFLAADSHAGRHWVNAISETYLIPATQVGVRVPVDEGGTVGRLHTVYRRMTPGDGCLWCNGLIKASELAIEMAPDAERAAARYVDGVPAASVITLNGIAAAQSTTDFMLSVTDLAIYDAADHHYEFVRDRSAMRMRPRRDSECGWCGDTDGVGERDALHVRLRMAHKHVRRMSSTRKSFYGRLRRLKGRPS